MKQTQISGNTPVPPTSPVNSETPLKTICAELKLEPKAARRRLRAAWRAKDSKLQHKLKDRWTDKTAILAVLSPTKQ